MLENPYDVLSCDWLSIFFGIWQPIAKKHLPIMLDETNNMIEKIIAVDTKLILRN